MRTSVPNPRQLTNTPTPQLGAPNSTQHTHPSIHPHATPHSRRPGATTSSLITTGFINQPHKRSLPSYLRGDRGREIWNGGRPGWKCVTGLFPIDRWIERKGIDQPSTTDIAPAVQSFHMARLRVTEGVHVYEQEDKKKSFSFVVFFFPFRIGLSSIGNGTRFCSIYMFAWMDVCYA